MNWRVGCGILFWLLTVFDASAQRGIVFASESQKRVTIPFRLINNLIFIDVAINGASLTMLLDTGVDDTILFSLEEGQQVNLGDIRKVRLLGLGGAETVEGLVSTGNRLSIKSLNDQSHTVFIVLDQGFNFSATVGIPVNGIIGYQFFRNYPVEIDYAHKRLIVHRELPARAGKFKRIPISVEENKPYVHAEVGAGSLAEAKLLLDLGNSDALWLFQDRIDSTLVSGVTDYLGRGLSGDIMGVRGRIPSFAIAGFRFRDVVTAFPASETSRMMVLVPGRKGSVGGEALRRFRVLFDYRGGALFLKPTRHLGDPFQYNMSGLEIHHEGTQWIREPESMLTVSYEGDAASQAARYATRFELKPVYIIVSVREGSPADQAGLRKGDILQSVNGKSAYDLKLHDIAEILRSEEGKVIKLKVLRRDRELTFRFVLKKLI